MNLFHDHTTNTRDNNLYESIIRGLLTSEGISGRKYCLVGARIVSGRREYRFVICLVVYLIIVKENEKISAITVSAIFKFFFVVFVVVIQLNE